VPPGHSIEYGEFQEVVSAWKQMARHEGDASDTEARLPATFGRTLTSSRIVAQLKKAVSDQSTHQHLHPHMPARSNAAAKRSCGSVSVSATAFREDASAMAAYTEEEPFEAELQHVR
jgi:site-specific recombinase XerC